MISKRRTHSSFPFLRRREFRASSGINANIAPLPKRGREGRGRDIPLPLQETVSFHFFWRSIVCALDRSSSRKGRGPLSPPPLAMQCLSLSNTPPPPHLTAPSENCHWLFFSSKAEEEEEEEADVASIPPSTLPFQMLLLLRTPPSSLGWRERVKRDPPKFTDEGMTSYQFVLGETLSTCFPIGKEI